jgi:hypothetical protein
MGLESSNIQQQKTGLTFVINIFALLFKYRVDFVQKLLLKCC